MRLREKSAGRRRLLLASLLCTVVVADAGRTEAKVQQESEKIRICVIDSGCNLAEIEGWNFLEDSEFTEDSVGHGTTIVSLLQEIAPDAEVIMLKCFDHEVNVPSDEQKEAEDTNVNKAVISAIYAAVDWYHADIIHMSWACREENKKLREAIAYAAAQNIVLVAATGNLSFEMGIQAVTYPAAWDEVIGVGGVHVGEHGPESSLWYLTGTSVYVCACADYKTQHGTSYAAARITGLVAEEFELWRQSRDRMEAVCRMLRDRAEDLGEPGYDTQYGWGYIR